MSLWRRLRFPRGTLRIQLALLYAGFFAACGVVLLVPVLTIRSSLPDTVTPAILAQNNADVRDQIIRAGAILVALSALSLGAGWLILKTQGTLQDWARALGRRALIGVLVGIALVSLWTPFAKPQIAERWFSWPDIVIFAPVPIVTVLIAYWEWRSLNNRSEAAPFIGAVLLFVMSYLGIAISLFPLIVPYKFTLWDAASSPSTQAFLLVGTVFLLPVILMYSGWSYWVFRGKVRGDLGYH